MGDFARKFELCTRGQRIQIARMDYLREKRSAANVGSPRQVQTPARLFDRLSESDLALLALESTHGIAG